MVVSADAAARSDEISPAIAVPPAEAVAAGPCERRQGAARVPTMGDGVGLPGPSRSEGRSSMGDYSPIKVLYRGRRTFVISALSPDGEVVAVKGYYRSEISQVAAKVHRELVLLYDLRHPHIIEGRDCWVDAHCVYMVQEFAVFGDLKDVAARFRHECVPEALLAQRIARPMLLAFSYLHKRGVIHRDIKPENVVVTGDGVTKLCDFGLAIDTKTDTPTSRVGTAEFMAPEVVILGRPGAGPKRCSQGLRADASAAYGFTVDIWSFGCVIFELLYGTPLFGGPGVSEAEIEEAILCPDPFAFPEHTPAGKPVSAAVHDFLAAALTFSGERRPSANALLRSEWMKMAQEASAAAAKEDAKGPEGAKLAAADPSAAVLTASRRGMGKEGPTGSFRVPPLPASSSLEVPKMRSIRLSGKGDAPASQPGAPHVVVTSVTDAVRLKGDSATDPPRASPKTTLLFPSEATSSHGDVTPERGSSSDSAAAGGRESAAPPTPPQRPLASSLRMSAADARLPVPGTAQQQAGQQEQPPPLPPRVRPAAGAPPVAAAETETKQQEDSRPRTASGASASSSSSGGSGGGAKVPSPPAGPAQRSRPTRGNSLLSLALLNTPESPPDGAAGGAAQEERRASSGPGLQGLVGPAAANDDARVQRGMLRARSEAEGAPRSGGGSGASPPMGRSFAGGGLQAKSRMPHSESLPSMSGLAGPDTSHQHQQVPMPPHSASSAGATSGAFSSSTGSASKNANAPSPRLSLGSISLFGSRGSQGPRRRAPPVSPGIAMLRNWQGASGHSAGGSSTATATSSVSLGDDSSADEASVHRPRRRAGPPPGEFPPRQGRSLMRTRSLPTLVGGDGDDSGRRSPAAGARLKRTGSVIGRLGKFVSGLFTTSPQQSLQNLSPTQPQSPVGGSFEASSPSSSRRNSRSSFSLLRSVASGGRRQPRRSAVHPSTDDPTSPSAEAAAAAAEESFSPRASYRA